MGIYIYGAGSIGRRLLDKATNYDVRVDGFIDSYKKDVAYGYPIVDISDISKGSTVNISVLNTNSILDILRRLRDASIEKIYWFHDYDNKDFGNGLDEFLKNECLNMCGWGEMIMPHIELHISDKCNLNCRGCTHFSPLFDEVGAVLEDKIADIRSLKEIFDEIFRIDILGGEPLLNPQLDEYVVELRKELPKAFIQIYTNGLLIPQLSEDVLMKIKENNVSISISEYLPTHKMIDKITDKLNQYGIHYRIAAFDIKQKFNTPISTNPNSKYPKLCISDGCITVDKGRICKCPTLMYIEKFNEYFNENLPTEGIYNIKDYKDGNKLLEDMEKVVPLCKHCIHKDMDWSVCDREKKFEDFAVRE